MKDRRAHFKRNVLSLDGLKHCCCLCESCPVRRLVLGAQGLLDCSMMIKEMKSGLIQETSWIYSDEVGNVSTWRTRSGDVCDDKALQRVPRA